jgi:outer membrane usher protein
VKTWCSAPAAESRGTLRAACGLLAAAVCVGAQAAEQERTEVAELGAVALEAGGILSRAALDAAVANQTLYLQTFLNGVDTRLISPYRLIGGALYGDAAELRQIGFGIDEEVVGAGGLVELTRIPGLVYRLDALRQVVEITVGAEQLQERRYDASTASPRASVSPGAVLNYEAFAQRTDTETGLAEQRTELYSGFLDLRAFAPMGTLLQTGLFRSADPEPADFEPALRLDTTLFHSDADRLDTWRAGDVISGAGLSWVSPVRLGGLQWQRNFRLQPNLVTFPLPTIAGSSAVPSTVDILVNNVQTYSRPVEPGPFVIDNMPVMTGQGEIRVVVKDALGREQVSTLPFYASSSLLRPGLLDYSIEAGYLRRNYALESNDYADQPAALASLRTGLTDWFTLESHAEGTAGLFNGGIGGVARLGLAGVLSGSVASSTASGSGGQQWTAAYQWTSRHLGFAASTQQATGGYQTLASLDAGVAPTRAVSQVSASTTVAGGGLSVAYVAVRGSTLLSASTAAGDQETRLGTVSYSLALRGRWAAYVSLFREFSGDETAGATAGLSHFFGGRTSASLGVQYREGQDAAATVQATQSLPAEGTGPGWRLQGTGGATQSAALSAGYRYPVATFETGVADNGDASSAFASLRGAIVGMDLHRKPLLTNAVHDAFALVDTVMPDVNVLYENRPVGRSNADGLLLIPHLTAQSRNQISIDARDLPLSAEVAAVKEIAVPVDRSGVFVQFPVKQVDSALVVLRTADGKAVPPGATATLNGQAFIVGYDGQAYLRNVGPRNWLDVDWGDGSCRVQFEYHAPAEGLPTIGPLRCPGITR